ncbi:MAG: sugar phosphate isomerase/epimerase family protein [Bryobacteraceae bacterium]
MKKITRREQIGQLASGVLGLASARLMRAQAYSPRLFFKIALGEYSFNTSYRAGKYDPLKLASMTKNQFGLNAIDYVSSFWANKASDRNFLRELKKRAHDNAVVNHIILVDMPGAQLGDLDGTRRKMAVREHRRWIDIAAFLGCRGIRVNLNGFQPPGNKDAFLKASVDGYGRLLEYAGQHDLDVLVQNHIGYSCDPDWLAAVMKQVDNKHAGIEADPGHFQELFFFVDPHGKHVTKKGRSFDTYSGMAKLMPYAKSVNAKTHAFDANGDESTLDYNRLLKIVKDAGYTGYIGIEWEPKGNGRKLSDSQGIEATKALLERAGSELS